MRKPRETAVELIAKLKRDPKFTMEEARRTEQHRLRREELRDAGASLVTELGQLGYHVSSPSELLERQINYDDAIPLLKKWLRATDEIALKEIIVRMLSIPSAHSAAPLLIEEYRHQDNRGLKWAIANALSIIADDAVFEDISTLAKERNAGKIREMIC